MAIDFKITQEGLIEFTETLLDQPVTSKDSQGSLSTIKNASRNIVTKWTLSIEEINIQLAQLNKKKIDVIKQQDLYLQKIEDDISNLKSALVINQ